MICPPQETSDGSLQALQVPCKTSNIPQLLLARCRPNGSIGPSQAHAVHALSKLSTMPDPLRLQAQQAPHHHEGMTCVPSRAEQRIKALRYGTASPTALSPSQTHALHALSKPSTHSASLLPQASPATTAESTILYNRTGCRHTDVCSSTPKQARQSSIATGDRH